MRKSTHVMLVLSLAAIFAGASLSAMAQQPGGAAAGAPVGGPPVAVLGTDAVRKATVSTFQSDTLVVQHEYYWWRGNCYRRNPSGNYALVLPGACS
jgi:hypothetical protein